PARAVRKIDLRQRRGNRGAVGGARFHHLDDGARRVVALQRVFRWHVVVFRLIRLYEGGVVLVLDGRDVLQRADDALGRVAGRDDVKGRGQERPVERDVLLQPEAVILLQKADRLATGIEDVKRVGARRLGLRQIGPEILRLLEGRE